MGNHGMILPYGDFHTGNVRSWFMSSHETNYEFRDEAHMSRGILKANGLLDTRKPCEHGFRNRVPVSGNYLYTKLGTCPQPQGF